MNALRFLKNNKNTLITIVVISLILGPVLASAATGSGTGTGTGSGASDAFVGLYDMVKGLLAGSLGKLLTILALGVALIIAVKVQSVIGILGAFAIALSAVYGPAVLESLFTATLPIAQVAHAAAPAVSALI